MEDRKQGSPRENVKRPVLFLLEHVSGLEAAVYMLNGHVTTHRGFGAQVAGSPDLVSTTFVYQRGRPWGHSTGQVYLMEELILTGREPYPPERTLLTTGTLAALMDSTYRGAVRIETPHLAITYDPPKGNLFNRGPMPPLEPA